MRCVTCWIPWGCITLAFQEHKLEIVFVSLFLEQYFAYCVDTKRFVELSESNEHMIVL